jgi:hypothetical protein
MMILPDITFQNPKQIRNQNVRRLDELAKIRNSMKFVIPANPGSGPGQAPESSYFEMSWTPAFAGVTAFEFWSFVLVSKFMFRYSNLPLRFFSLS